MDKTIIGLVEDVTIIGEDGQKVTRPARIDTGAMKASLDLKMVSEMQLGPVLATKFVKSANGRTLRPIIEAKIVLAGKEITGQFTLADRSKMKYDILIGRNILKGKDFLLDPDK